MNNSTAQQKFYFSDLNDSQRQKLADRLLNDHPMRLQNTLVEYVLQKSYEDSEAPFSYDDIENFNYTGYVEINGSQEEIDEEEKDRLLEKYEYLSNKIENIIDDLENEQLNIEDDQEYDNLQSRIDRLENTKYRCDKNIDNLEFMDFDEQPEIMQWFSCTDYLISELEKHGQCTLDREFWGRCTFGQSVTLDHVIQRIAFEYACDYKKDYLTLKQIGDL